MAKQGTYNKSRMPLVLGVIGLAVLIIIGLSLLFRPWVPDIVYEKIQYREYMEFELGTVRKYTGADGRKLWEVTLNVKRDDSSPIKDDIPLVLDDLSRGKYERVSSHLWKKGLRIVGKVEAETNGKPSGNIIPITRLRTDDLTDVQFCEPIDGSKERGDMVDDYVQINQDVLKKRQQVSLAEETMEAHNEKERLKQKLKNMLKD